MDNSADNAPIVNTRHAMRQREIVFDVFELGFSEPKIIRHGQVLLPSLNHDFCKDGIRLWQTAEMPTERTLCLACAPHPGRSPGALSSSPRRMAARRSLLKVSITSSAIWSCCSCRTDNTP